MPFRFSLAPVLKLRGALEERELHKLEQTQHQIAGVVHLLESLGHEQSSARINREAALAKGSPAADLHFHELLRRGMNARQSILEKMLDDLQVHRTRHLECYEAAKRGREVLSDLRDRRRAAHESKAARQQQRVTDDSFLARSRQG
jgi:flagellar export protein FliJ